MMINKTWHKLKLRIDTPAVISKSNNRLELLNEEIVKTCWHILKWTACNTFLIVKPELSSRSPKRIRAVDNSIYLILKKNKRVLIIYLVLVYSIIIGLIESWPSVNNTLHILNVAGNF